MRKVSIHFEEDPRYKEKWHVRYYDARGCRKRAIFPNKRMAEIYADKIRADIFNMLISGVESVDLPTLFSLFYQSKPELQPRTLLCYKSVQDAFCEAVGPIRSNHLNLEHITRWRASLTGSAAYRNKRLRHLHAVLEWAHKHKHTRENLANAIDMFKEPKRLKTVWSMDQFLTVLSHCDRETRMLALLCVNGCGRVGSVSTITGRNVDLVAGQVRLIDEKTNTERITPLHPMVLSELKTYCSLLDNLDCPLFKMKFHHERWQKIVEKANVPFMKFHDLRTCLSTWLQSQGVSSEIVAQIFGHSSSAITQQHYTNLNSTSLKREAIDRLVINKAAPPESTDGAESKKKEMD